MAIKVAGTVVIDDSRVVSNLGSALTVSNGGTGATSLTANTVLIGNGTNTVKVVSPGTTGNILTSDGTTWTSTALTATISNRNIDACTFINGYTEETFTSNTGSSFTISLTNGTIQFLTLNANCTISTSSASLGQSFMLFLKQDATGGRTVTFSGIRWPSNVTPTVTTTAGRVDKFVFTSDSTTWYGSVAGQNYTPI